MKHAMTLAAHSCIILAGGLGTRLRKAVPDMPKVLALVRGVPFMTFLLWQLEEAGFRHVVLSTGYKSDAVEHVYGSEFGKMQIEYSREPHAMGTGGAVRLASAQAMPGAMLVMNGDSYCELDFAAFAKAHASFGGLGTLALAFMDDTSRFGRVDCAPDGRILEFKEKSPNGAPGHINAGIYWMEPEIIQEIPSGVAVSLERDIFPQNVQTGALFAWGHSRRFIDIGTPESYQEADDFLRANSTSGCV